MSEQRLRHNLETVYRRIADAAQRSSRLADSVRLVAVTKKSPTRCGMGSIVFDRAADTYDATRGFPPGIAERVATLVEEAKQTGVVQKAIDAKGLKGVNVATK